MKIGILGGAFNPPHKGHVKLASLVNSFFDQIWVLPAYDHMHGKQMESSNHRLEMCRRAFAAAGDDVHVSDYEIVNKINDGTFSLMWRLGNSFKNYQFSFVIGQDNADTIESWRQYQQLITLTPFTVVPRKGYAVNKNPDIWYRQHPHRYLQGGASLPEISSTKIRESLSKGEKPEHLHRKVFDYIKKNRLYSK